MHIWQHQSCFSVACCCWLLHNQTRASMSNWGRFPTYTGATLVPFITWLALCSCYCSHAVCSLVLSRMLLQPWLGNTCIFLNCNYLVTWSRPGMVPLSCIYESCTDTQAAVYKPEALRPTRWSPNNWLNLLECKHSGLSVLFEHAFRVLQEWWEICNAETTLQTIRRWSDFGLCFSHE